MKFHHLHMSFVQHNPKSLELARFEKYLPQESMHKDPVLRRFVASSHVAG